MDRSPQRRVVRPGPERKTISNTGIGLYRFDDAGKILGSEVETDRLGLLQQLGLVDASLGAPRPR